MHKLNIHRTGLAIGVFFGFIHLLWVLAVSMGLAEGKLNYVLGLHFLSVPFTMLEFSWQSGVMLIVITTIIGYVVGAIFACTWNRVAVR